MRLPNQISEGVKRLNPSLSESQIRSLIPVVKDSFTTESNAIVKESLPVQPTKEEMKNEKQFQEQVAALLRNRGIVFQRSRMDCKTTGTVGMPDFLFAVNGKPCALECKMPAGIVSEDQRRCIEGMRENGWDVRVVRSIDEVLEALKEWGAEELR